MKLIKIFWSKPDDRGAVGKLLDGTKKLVRLDMSSSIVPVPGTVQACTATHDTNPRYADRGVLFVLPQAKAVTWIEFQNAKNAERTASVRVEWEAEITKMARTNLRGLMSFEIYIYRFKYDIPSEPSLRTRNGHAEIWTGTPTAWKEQLMSLPELGEGIVLATALAAAWFERSTLANAQEQADRLGFTFEDVQENAIKEHSKEWTGFLVFDGQRIGERRVLASNVNCIPGYLFLRSD